MHISQPPYLLALTAPSDYIAIQRELRFDPDVSAQTVSISIQNDVVLELSESFAVELQISAYSMGLQLSQFNRTTVTITDNDSKCHSCIDACKFNINMASHAGFT